METYTESPQKAEEKKGGIGKYVLLGLALSGLAIGMAIKKEDGSGGDSDYTIAEQVLPGGYDNPVKERIADEIVTDAVKEIEAEYNAPTGYSITNEPASTEASTPENIYKEISKGGTFEQGDKVAYLGVKGVFTSGKISETGDILTSSLIIKNENDQTILNYQHSNNPSLGRVELISYPQPDNPECSEPCVLLKVNGVDSGYRMEYGSSLEGYLAMISTPNNIAWGRENGYILN